MLAASEPGSDASKRIHQRHFDEAIREVIAGRRVMRQSLAPPAEPAPHVWIAGLAPLLLALCALLVAVAALVIALVR
jgi:hypothetical protein